MEGFFTDSPSSKQGWARKKHGFSIIYPIFVIKLKRLKLNEVNEWLNKYLVWISVAEI